MHDHKCTTCNEKLKVMKISTNILYYCNKCKNMTSKEAFQ
ncbi:YfgJ family double zinc ribbon protein [Methanohalophilus levihalophilus]